MSLPPLPEHATDFDLSQWSTVEPYFQELLTRPLSRPDSTATTNGHSAGDGRGAPDAVGTWLADWSHLTELVAELASLTSIAYSQDTEDPERKAAYMRFIREIGPKLRVVEQQLKDRLLETGWEAPEMGIALRQFRADKAIFRDANVPILADEQAMSAAYSERIGGLTVDFDGGPRTLAQLAPYRASADRAVREGAWRAHHAKMLEYRGELDELYEKLLGLRLQIAANAGFDNYRDYKWQQLGRFDYTPEDAATFREAIHAACVPALRRLVARRAAAMGLDRPGESLRPWDMENDLHGRAPLKPFATGEELAQGSMRIFDQLDPELGGMVRTMHSAGLLDLDNRKGKAPGGYCATLPKRGLPFIFMNAVGTEENVRTMLHEAGHAFHGFDRQALPLIWQRRSPMEFNEVASMSMELLTLPYLERKVGGFYGPAESVRAQIEQLERIIVFLPYMATVDAFQDWVYAQPDHSRAERDAAWKGLHERFCVGPDWSGLEASRESLWHHKQHIFQVPFYYIEYGIAQTGALQVWRNSLQDPKAALASYRRALHLGGMVPLPALFEAAGAELRFDAGLVGDLVGLIEGRLEELGGALGELG